MTAEEQLERSVLEGKERDELHAIAQAMSLKTTSRTKKSDIIDRILEAAGVSSSNGTNGHAARASDAAERTGVVTNGPERDAAASRPERGPEPAHAAADAAADDRGAGGSGAAAAVADAHAADAAAETVTVRVDVPQTHEAGATHHEIGDR